MGSLVVVLLLVLWASILLPGLVRARREAAPHHTVSTFERCMSMLAPAAGRPLTGRASSQTRRPRRPVGPGRQVLVLRDAAAIATGRGRSRVLRRRRALLLRLAAGTGLGAVAAVTVGSWAWAVLAVAAGALVAYVGLLLRLRGLEAEVRRKVRPLPPAVARSADDAARPAEGAVLTAAAGQQSGTVLLRRWQD